MKASNAGLPAAFVLIAAAIGCEMKGDRVTLRHEPPPQPGVWQVKPVRLRVYPSTRFVLYENQPALEARIEFLDELGDPLKAVGAMRFEVYAANRDGEIVDQRRLFSWDVPMLTREANQEYYDPVTRAYLFRLGFDSLPKDLERTVVRVIHQPVSGERMEATAVVRVQ